MSIKSNETGEKKKKTEEANRLTRKMMHPLEEVLTRL